MSYITGSNRQLEAYVNYLDIVAEETLRQEFVWKAVERLAEALLELGTVKWRQGRDVIMSSLGFTTALDGVHFSRHAQYYHLMRVA